MKRYKDAWKSMTYFLFQMIVIGYFLCLKTPQNAPTALFSKKNFRGSMPPHPPSRSAYTQKSSRHAPGERLNIILYCLYSFNFI